MNSRVNEIDLLRFLAALSVLFFHYTFRGFAADDMSVVPYLGFAPFSKYGYLGVNLFFMISGFVILMSVGDGNLKKFILSRVIRLYPAFWIACTLTFVITLYMGDKHFHATLMQYLENLTLISGFVGVEPMDGVYWTLLVEIRFYILIGIFLLIYDIKDVEIFLIFWLFLSVLMVFFPTKILSQIFITNHSSYFIAGAIYFLIYKNGLNLQRVSMLMISLAIAIFVSHTQTIPTDIQHYHVAFNPMVTSAIISSFFVIMLLVSLKSSGIFSKISYITLGSLTYPLYLIHQNIGFMIFNYGAKIFEPHTLLIMVISSMLLLAFIVYLFEKVIANYLKRVLGVKKETKEEIEKRKIEEKIKKMDFKPMRYPL
jgi:peptidoglycan/LPS O-acetylase OafA/YrhL